MSVPLTKGWKLHSIDDWSFNVTSFDDTNKGECFFTAKVRPIDPFDVRDLYQEYHRLVSKSQNNVRYNICGKEFFIYTLSIPNHFCYLSVGLASSALMEYQDAKDIMNKLSSLAETSHNPYGLVAIHSFNDYRPWYKRIFDRFL